MDHPITALLRAHRGNVRAVARAMGTPYETLRKRVLRESLYPADLPKRAGHVAGDKDARTTAAIVAAGGNMRAASRALGLEASTVRSMVHDRPWVFPAGVRRLPASGAWRTA